MNDHFNLTDGGAESAKESRFLIQPECKKLVKQCLKLMSLTGLEALTGLDLAIVEQVAQDVELATEEDMDIVNDIYEQREREAALNGQPWEAA